MLPWPGGSSPADSNFSHLGCSAAGNRARPVGLSSESSIGLCIWLAFYNIMCVHVPSVSLSLSVSLSIEKDNGKHQNINTAYQDNILSDIFLNIY